MSDRDLKALERRTFRTATDDGLWDVLIAEAVAMFAVIPLLSDSLGYVGSSAILLPVALVTYLIIRSVRHHVVIPRLGTVRVGIDRRRRLRRSGVALLLFNAFASIIGLTMALGGQIGWVDRSGLTYPFAVSIIGLIAFSLGAYATSIPRYALYGFLLAATSLLGGWLWQDDLAGRDGYPVWYGIVALIIFVVGIARFAASLRSHPLPQDPVTV